MRHREVAGIWWAMKLPSWAACALVFATGCGPGPRYGDTDWRPDARADSHAGDATSSTGDAAVAPVCGELTFVFRDFRSDHVDMQSGAGIDTGLVQLNLGSDDKPVYAPAAATTTVAGSWSFNQWYRDVPNVNTTVATTVSLTENPPGTFTFDDQSFFPLDGLGFGNQTNPHNFHFTTEIHSTFTYNGGEIFQFVGDDDVFVFVNKKLAVDLGGVHDPLSGMIDFDARQTELGITPGQTYQLDVFHAERHTVSSTFRMVTTIDCLVIL